MGADPPWERASWVEELGEGDARVRIELEGLSGFERNAAIADAHARAVDPRRRVEHSPMFGVIWPAGRVLAELIARDPGIPGSDVLELACGLALPSLVAARRGARVLATDHHPSAQGFLEANARRNGVDVAFAQVDLRDPPVLRPDRFDRVVGSDLLFARDMPPLAAAAFARWLRPGGTGWLLDPGRAWMGDLERCCRDQGLSLDEDVIEVAGEAVFLCIVRV